MTFVWFQQGVDGVHVWVGGGENAVTLEDTVSRKGLHTAAKKRDGINRGEDEKTKLTT